MNESDSQVVHGAIGMSNRLKANVDAIVASTGGKTFGGSAVLNAGMGLVTQMAAMKMIEIGSTIPFPSDAEQQKAWDDAGPILFEGAQPLADLLGVQVADLINWGVARAQLMQQWAREQNEALRIAERMRAVGCDVQVIG